MTSRIRRFRASGRVVASVVAASGTCASVLAAPPEIAISKVVAGKAGLSIAGDTATVRASDRSIINFSRLSVPGGSTLRFEQPSTSSRVLGRIAGASPTKIDGNLQANGRVYLLNRAGIMFGPTAVVNVGALYAAAGDISNSDFLRGIDRFVTAPGGVVTNLGSITADENVALIARSVINTGTVNSRLGFTAFAAGPDVFIGENGSNVLVKITPHKGAAPQGDGVRNEGAVTGRHVVFATGDLLGSTVFNSGRVRAPGGSVTVKSDTQVTNTPAAELSASSPTTHAGSVSIHAGPQGTATLSGSIDASASNYGTRGGSVDITGGSISLVAGTIDASGPGGGGTVRFGGGELGAPIAIDLPNSSLAFISADSAIRASATDLGHAGSIIVFSEQSTNVQGALIARGGPRGGAGGFIETSGRHGLRTLQAPDVSAPSGAPGVWLIDPRTVRIVNGSDLNFATQSPPPPPTTFQGTTSSAASVEDAQIGVDLIQSALQNGNVIVQTGAGSDGDGDIFLDTTLTFTAGGAQTGNPTLTLSAFRNININGAVAFSSSNAQVTGLNLSLVANTGGAGGAVSFANAVARDLAQGTLSASGTSFTLGVGSLTANRLAVTTTGDISIQNGADVTVNRLELNAANASVSQAAAPINLGDSSVAGTLFVTTAGAITQAAATTINAGAADLTSTAGSITLGNTAVTNTLSLNGAAGLAQNPSTTLSAASASLTSTSGSASAVNLPRLTIPGSVTVSTAAGGAALGSTGALQVTSATVAQALTLNSAGTPGASVNAAGLNVTGNVNAFANTVSLNSGAATLNIGQVTAGTGATAITGAAVNLGATSVLNTGSGTGSIIADAFSASAGASITGTGALTIRPATVSRDVNIGGASPDTGVLGLSATDIAALGSTFSGITVGSTDLPTGTSPVTGVYTMNGPATFASPLTIATSNRIDITAAAAFTLGTSKLTLLAPNITAAADTSVVTTADQVIVAPLDPSASVALGSGAAGDLSLSDNVLGSLTPVTGELSIGDPSAPASGVNVGNVSLNRNTTFNAHNGSVNITGTVDANNRRVTIKGGDVSLTGTITDTDDVRFTGARRVTVGDTDAGSFNLTNTEISQLPANATLRFDTRTAADHVRFSNATAGGRDVAVDPGATTELVELTGTNSTIGRPFDIGRPVQLFGGTTTIDTTAGAQANGALVRFRSTVAGAGQSLAITPGLTGNVTFDGAVGGSGALAALNVTASPTSANTASLNAALSAATVDLGAGSITLGAASSVSATTSAAFRTGTITANNAANSITSPAVTFTTNDPARAIAVGSFNPGAALTLPDTTIAKVNPTGLTTLTIGDTAHTGALTFGNTTIGSRSTVLQRAPGATGVITNAANSTITGAGGSLAVGTAGNPNDLQVADATALTVNSGLNVSGAAYGTENGAAESLTVTAGGAGVAASAFRSAAAAPQGTPDATGLTTVIVNSAGSFTASGGVSLTGAFNAGAVSTLTGAVSTGPITAGNVTINTASTTGTGAVNSGDSIAINQAAGAAGAGQVTINGAANAAAAGSINVRGAGITLAQGFTAGTAGAAFNATDTDNNQTQLNGAPGVSGAGVTFTGNASIARNVTANNGTISITGDASIGTGGQPVTLTSNSAGAASGVSVAGNTTLLNTPITVNAPGGDVTFTGSVTSAPTAPAQSLVIQNSRALAFQNIVSIDGDLTTAFPATEGISAAGHVSARSIALSTAANKTITLQQGFDTTSAATGTASFTAQHTFVRGQASTAARDMTVTGDLTTSGTGLGVTNGGLTVQQNAGAGGTLTHNAASLSTSGNITVAADATLNGTTTAGAMLLVGNNLFANAATTAGTGIDVNNNAAITAVTTATTGTIDIAGNALVYSTGAGAASLRTLGPSGTIDIHGNLELRDPANASTGTGQVRVSTDGAGSPITIDGYAYVGGAGARNAAVVTTGANSPIQVRQDTRLGDITTPTSTVAGVRTSGTGSSVTLGDNPAADILRVANNTTADVTASNASITINAPVTGQAASAGEALTIAASPASGAVNFNSTIGADTTEALQSLSVTGNTVGFAGNVGTAANPGVTDLFRVRATDTIAFAGTTHHAGSMDINFVTGAGTKTASLAADQNSFFITDAGTLDLLLGSGAGLVRGTVTGVAGGAKETLTLDARGPAATSGDIRLGNAVASGGTSPDTSDLADITIRNASASPGTNAVTTGNVSIAGVFRAIDAIDSNVLADGRLRAGTIAITATPANSVITLNQGFEAASNASAADASDYAASFKAGSTVIAAGQPSSTSARGVRIEGNATILSNLGGDTTPATGNIDPVRNRDVTITGDTTLGAAINTASQAVNLNQKLSVATGAAALIDTTPNAAGAGANITVAQTIDGTANGPTESLSLDSGGFDVRIGDNAGFGGDIGKTDKLASLTINARTIRINGDIGSSSNQGGEGVTVAATLNATDTITLASAGGTGFFNVGSLNSTSTGDTTVNGRLRADSTVTMQAGQKIDLNRGFETRANGASFTAANTTFNTEASTSGANIVVTGDATVNASLTAATNLTVSNDLFANATVRATNGRVDIDRHATIAADISAGGIGGVTIDGDTTFAAGQTVRVRANGQVVRFGDSAARAITLNNNSRVTVNSNGGAVTFSGAVNGPGAGESLSIGSGAGNIVFGASIGDTGRIDTLAITTTGNITFNSAPTDVTRVNTLDISATGAATDFFGRLFADAYASIASGTLSFRRGFDIGNAPATHADDFSARFSAAETTIAGRAARSMKGLYINGKAILLADITTTGTGSVTAGGPQFGLHITGDTAVQFTSAERLDGTPATPGGNLVINTDNASANLARALTGNGASRRDLELITGTANATITGAIGGGPGTADRLDSLRIVAGITTLGGGSVGTTGSQSFDTDIKLVQGTAFTSDTSGTISFTRTVSAANGNPPPALTVNTGGMTTFAGDLFGLGPVETSPAGLTVLTGSLRTITATNVSFNDAVSFNNPGIGDYTVSISAQGDRPLGNIRFGSTIDGSNNAELKMNASNGVFFTGYLRGLRRLELNGMTFEVGPEITVFDEILVMVDTTLQQDLKLGGKKITFEKTVNGAGKNLEIVQSDAATFRGAVTGIASFTSAASGQTILGADFTAGSALFQNTLAFLSSGPFKITLNNKGVFGLVTAPDSEVDIRSSDLTFNGAGDLVSTFRKLTVRGLGNPGDKAAIKGKYASGIGGSTFEAPITLIGDTQWTATGGNARFKSTIAGGSFNFTFSASAASLMLDDDATGFGTLDISAPTIVLGTGPTDTIALDAKDIGIRGEGGAKATVSVNAGALALGHDPSKPSLAAGDATESISITGNILAFGSDPVQLRARAKSININGSVGSETNPVQSWEVFDIDGVDESVTLSDTVFVSAGNGPDQAALVIFRTPARLEKGLTIVRRGAFDKTKKRFAVLRFEKDLSIGGTVQFLNAPGTDPNDRFAMTRFEFRELVTLLGNTTFDFTNAGPASQGLFFFKGIQNAPGITADLTINVNTETPEDQVAWILRKPRRAATIDQFLANNVSFTDPGNPKLWAKVDYRDALPIIAFGGDVGTSSSPLGALRLNVKNGTLPIRTENRRFVKGSSDPQRTLSPKVATIWTGEFKEESSNGYKANELEVQDASRMLARADADEALSFFNLRLSTFIVGRDAAGRKTFGERGFYASDFIMGFNEKLTALSSLHIAANNAYLGDVSALGDLRINRRDTDVIGLNTVPDRNVYLLRREEGAIRSAFVSLTLSSRNNLFNPKPEIAPGIAPSDRTYAKLSGFHFNHTESSPGSAQDASKTLSIPLLDKGLDFVAAGQVIEFLGRVDATPEPARSEGVKLAIPKARFAAASAANGTIAGSPVLILRDVLDFNDPGAHVRYQESDNNLRDHTAFTLFREYFADPTSAQTSSSSSASTAGGLRLTAVGDATTRTLLTPTFDIALDLSADGLFPGANLTDLQAAFTGEVSPGTESFVNTSLSPEDREKFRDFRIDVRNPPNPTLAEGTIGRYLFNDAFADRYDNRPRATLVHENDRGTLRIVTADRLSLPRAVQALDILKSTESELKTTEKQVIADIHALKDPDTDESDITTQSETARRIALGELPEAQQLFTRLEDARAGFVRSGFSSSEAGGIIDENARSLFSYKSIDPNDDRDSKGEFAWGVYLQWRKGHSESPPNPKIEPTAEGAPQAPTDRVSAAPGDTHQQPDRTPATPSGTP